jgi:hypothetical protein
MNNPGSPSFSQIVSRNSGGQLSAFARLFSGQFTLLKFAAGFFAKLVGGDGAIANFEKDRINSHAKFTA